MKGFLRGGMSRRHGHDGWALKMRQASSPMWWTTSTTRAEAREIRRELCSEGLFARMDIDIVKVNIKAEVA
ncbi:MAG TPA: hypothetical protein VIG24_03780 [Acidimicrobiia bacterium]